jgi:hypothetical protein
MSKRERRLTDSDVRRRLLFLINEASQPDPIYDQTVQYALRVISNFYCIGRDGSSADVYKLSRYWSRNAHDLLQSGEWKGLTTRKPTQ